MIAYPPPTMGEVAERVAAKLNAGDVDGACDVIDECFLGQWVALMEQPGPLRAGEKAKALKDLRGLIVAVHKLAGRSSNAEPLHA